MIKNIDFGSLYREHLARSGRAFKPASDWDTKAAGMRKKALDSRYAAEFIARVHVNENDTVLDVGCGPGTIGLALAPKVKHVYGLDYSQGMLTALEQNVAELGLTNVDSILASWDDDWSAVPECDIAVVSRASIVADMGKALDKLHQQIRKRVYMTHLVGGRFVSREIAELLGRSDTSFPDHMYVINMLYQRNIYPTLNYIESPSRLAGSQSAEELIEKVSWSFGQLTATEKEILINWYQQDPDYASQGGEPMRWAFLSWDIK